MTSATGRLEGAVLPRAALAATFNEAAPLFLARPLRHAAVLVGDLMGAVAVVLCVPFVILDGKLFSSDRLAEQVTSVKGEEIDAWYSGKHHRPGGNVQAVMLPGGLPIWAGPAEPGHVHDITAARAHVLPALYRAASLGMPTLADSGYEGAGIGIHVPVKTPAGKQEPGIDTRTRNSLLRGLRFQGERGFALLTQRWAILQHITASPRDITQIVRAALILTQFEHKYIR